jgi:hypothetical protein
MKTYTTLLLLLVASPLLAQRLVPIHFSKAYQDPYYMVLEADSITAVLEHLETDNRLVIFDLEIVNKSGAPLKVDPKLFHYYAGSTPFPELADEADNIHNVSFPYSQVPGYLRKSLSKNAVEDHYRSQIKQQQTLAIVFGVLSVGMMVADVASDVRDSKKEFYTQKDWNKAQARDVLTASTLMTTDAVIRSTQEKNYYTKEELHYLDQEIMQPMDLPDTSALRGKIYFPKNGFYRYYRVVVPLEGYNFVFDFRKARAADY